MFRFLAAEDEPLLVLNLFVHQFVCFVLCCFICLLSA